MLRLWDEDIRQSTSVYNKDKIPFLWNSDKTNQKINNDNISSMKFNNCRFYYLHYVSNDIEGSVSFFFVFYEFPSTAIFNDEK